MSVVLINGGSQVPEMPLSEVSGSAGGTMYWHSGPIESNTGAVSGKMVMARVVSIVHGTSPSGVKIKKKVPRMSVLIAGGSQVPLIPLFDTTGSSGGGVNWHRGPI